MSDSADALITTILGFVATGMVVIAATAAVVAWVAAEEHPGPSGVQPAAETADQHERPCHHAEFLRSRGCELLTCAFLFSPPCRCREWGDEPWDGASAAALVCKLRADGCLTLACDFDLHPACACLRWELPLFADGFEAGDTASWTNGGAR